MTFLDPDLKTMIVARWQMTDAQGTGFPQSMLGDAVARSHLLREIAHAVYDETKRGTYSRTESESLTKVVDAVEAHAERMWMESREREG